MLRCQHYGQLNRNIHLMQSKRRNLDIEPQNMLKWRQIVRARTNRVMALRTCF
jgi:hypothetical protein